MQATRDQHQLVYHYADGVADILGLSTAQQLAIRTAMYLALREQAAAYEATSADMATQIHLLQHELTEATRSTEPQNATLPTLVATVSTNGTEPSSIRAGQTRHHADQYAVTFVPAAAQETASAEAQPDPTPAPAGKSRRPAAFKWPTLDDVSQEIVTNLAAGNRQWRTVAPDDKRIILLAAICELGQTLPPGEPLSIETFERHRPQWMPTFASLSMTLGMTWKQMLSAAPQI